MKFVGKALLAFAATLVVIQAVCAKQTPIPKTVDAGLFTVTVEPKLTDGWRVQVFREAGAVSYAYADFSETRETVAEIIVSRVEVPSEGRGGGAPSIADRLVRETTPLLQKRALEPHLFWWKGDNNRSRCAAGDVYLYSWRNGMTHGYYYYMAIILPADFRARGVAFLVFAHERNHSRMGRPRQLDRYGDVIEGIREKAS